MYLAPLTFNGTGQIQVIVTPDLEYRYYEGRAIRLLVSYETQYPIRIEDRRYNLSMQHDIGLRFGEDYLPKKNISPYFIYGETKIKPLDHYEKNEDDEIIFDYLKEQEKKFITKTVIETALSEYHASRIIELESDIVKARLQLDQLLETKADANANFKVNI